MGVMGCSRKGCGNILCDTYISNIGYVCGECQNEFTNYLTQEGLNPDTDVEIQKALNTFMDTEKNESIQAKKMDVYTFFKSHTN